MERLHTLISRIRPKTADSIDSLEFIDRQIPAAIQEYCEGSWSFGGPCSWRGNTIRIPRCATYNETFKNYREAIKAAAKEGEGHERDPALIKPGHQTYHKAYFVGNGEVEI